MVTEELKLTESEKRTRKELTFEWTALYEDGTSLDQYDDEKQLVHHFGHIDQDKIYEFELIPTRMGLLPLKVSLKTGLFYFNGEPVTDITRGNTHISLGLSLYNKKVSSSWGDKAKLIYLRHVRRNFTPGNNGFEMDVSIVYEIGWEANVDGVHEKHLLTVDEQGVIEIPMSFEQQGFKPI